MFILLFLYRNGKPYLIRCYFFSKCFKQNTIRNAISLCTSRYYVISENTNLPKYRRFTIFFQLLKFAQFDWLAFVQMTIFKLMSISTSIVLKILNVIWHHSFQHKILLNTVSHLSTFIHHYSTNFHAICVILNCYLCMLYKLYYITNW